MRDRPWQHYIEAALLTPEILTIESDKLDERIKALPQQDDGDNEVRDLYTIKEHALTLAEYMLKNELSGMQSIGPFSIVDRYVPRKGKRVIIPKGAKIHTTKDTECITSKRKNTVTVHRVSNGYVDTWNNPDMPAFPACIYWVGAGGHFYWVSLDDYNILPAD